ncbi:MAG: hypothetical protein U5S82_09015 [Gammaproteobacteria bacterium]|nr:hypothetical protein [Gammaproteobacteria bacterium]
MASGHTTETFVRLPEVDRLAWTMPARYYNRCRLFLARSETGCVFIPIRTMQYVGVVDAEEIVFVDSQGGHVRHDEDWGRPILISWRAAAGAARNSLEAGVPCEVIYYREGLDDIQQRLVSELGPALDRMEERYRDGAIPAQGAQVVPLLRE